MENNEFEVSSTTATSLSSASEKGLEKTEEIWGLIYENPKTLKRLENEFGTQNHVIYQKVCEDQDAVEGGDKTGESVRRRAGRPRRPR
jgi:hypothetical protein